MYQEYVPTARLADYIQCFWQLEHDYGHKAFAMGERIWPDGNYELIYSYNTPYFLAEDPDQSPLPTPFLIGLHDRPLLLNSHGVTKLLAIRFHAWGLFPFAKTALRNLHNQVAPARDVLRLPHLVPDPSDFTALETYFEAHVPKALNEVQLIAQWIYKAQGICTIGELQDEFKISRRKLQRDFENRVGISAKHFAKIVRFNFAKKAIERDTENSIARIAYQYGYADQPHFARNFKELFGITPSDHRHSLKMRRDRLPSP